MVPNHFFLKNRQPSIYGTTDGRNKSSLKISWNKIFITFSIIQLAMLIWLIVLTMYMATGNKNYYSTNEQQSKLHKDIDNVWIHTFKEKNIQIEEKIDELQNEFSAHCSRQLIQPKFITIMPVFAEVQ